MLLLLLLLLELLVGVMPVKNIGAFLV